MKKQQRPRYKNNKRKKRREKQREKEKEKKNEQEEQTKKIIYPQSQQKKLIKQVHFPKLKN